jgi:hypothetical protein
LNGLEFSTIAYTLIAIATVFVLITFLNYLYPDFVGSNLCKIYTLISSFPIPDFLKPDLSNCIPQETKRIKVEFLDSDLLLNYIISCWRMSNEGKSGKTFICYEIFGRTGNANERELTEKLKSRKYCEKIQNNYLDIEKQSYDCGNKNLIFWNITINNSDMTIIIKYNALAHRIEIL